MGSGTRKEIKDNTIAGFTLYGTGLSRCCHPRLKRELRLVLDVELLVAPFILTDQVTP
jgi:hypothetical protein